MPPAVRVGQLFWRPFFLSFFGLFFGRFWSPPGPRPGPKSAPRSVPKRPKIVQKSVSIRVLFPDAAWGAKRVDLGSILGLFGVHFWSFFGPVAAFLPEVVVSSVLYKKTIDFDDF